MKNFNRTNRFEIDPSDHTEWHPRTIAAWNKTVALKLAEAEDAELSTDNYRETRSDHVSFVAERAWNELPGGVRAALRAMRQYL